MAKYKSKATCVGSIPFWASDLIGIDNFNKLNAGEDVTISEPQPQVLEWIEVVEVEESEESGE
jgi:hypothetical protein|tara:strand:+ start:2291 stop:2479 length:189 start_codon:yes stop_codon:yes gene_type:complete